MGVWGIKSKIENAGSLLSLLQYQAFKNRFLLLIHLILIPMILETAIIICHQAPGKVYAKNALNL